jgi:hypothetical protein
MRLGIGRRLPDRLMAPLAFHVWISRAPYPLPTSPKVPMSPHNVKSHTLSWGRNRCSGNVVQPCRIAWSPPADASTLSYSSGPSSSPSSAFVFANSSSNVGTNTSLLSAPRNNSKERSCSVTVNFLPVCPAKTIQQGLKASSSVR